MTLQLQELTDEQLCGLGLAYDDVVALRIHVRSTLGLSSTSGSSDDPSDDPTVVELSCWRCQIFYMSST